ncbi:MAG: histidine triad nucleotide-binding protein [Janthinobacterium lividum]
MDNCIFCKIVAGQIPSSRVYEDDDVIAFHDINPAAPLHLLVVPKEHVATLADCSGEHAPMLGKMMLLAPRLASEFGSAIETDATGKMSGGFRTVFNVGPGGGQEVYHLHLHILGGARPWRGFP